VTSGSLDLLVGDEELVAYARLNRQAPLVAIDNLAKHCALKKTVREAVKHNSLEFLLRP
jgi:hypothetical protein